MTPRRGISPLISIVMYTAVVVASVGIIFNVVFPMVDRMQDTGAIQNQITFLNSVDDHIQAVRSEGRYSTRTPRLAFGRGHFEFDNTTDTLSYEIETRSNIISSQAARQIGAVTLSADASVTVTATRRQGINCYLMQSEHLEACIRRVPRVWDADDHPELVGYYRMDEGSGQWVNDSSTSGNNAMRGGSTASETSDPDWVSGIWETGLNFTNSESATIPRSSTLDSTFGTDGFTLAFWIKPTPDTGRGDTLVSWQTVNGTGVTHSARTEYVGGQNDSIYTRFIAENSSCGDNTEDGGFWARNGNMGMTPGQWNFYAVTYNGTMIREYMNGRVQATDTRGCDLADLSSDITLSGTPNTHVIDDLRIYNRSLPQEQVQWLHQQRGDLHYVNTSMMLVSLRNRGTGRTFDGTMYVQINGSKDARTGRGHTTARTGTALPTGTVTLNVSNSGEGDYNVTYDMFSGSDFLAVGADAPNVTVGLEYALSSRAVDDKYIDGVQRGDGIYTTNDIDFGSAISTDGTMVAGLVAGTGFTQVGFDNTTTHGYGFNITASGDSLFFLPFTVGNPDDIEERQDVIENGVYGPGNFLGYPSPSFGFDLERRKTVRVSLAYDNIILTGMTNQISPGVYTLYITNKGTRNGKPVIDLEVE